MAASKLPPTSLDGPLVEVCEDEAKANPTDKAPQENKEMKVGGEMEASDTMKEGDKMQESEPDEQHVFHFDGRWKALVLGKRR